MLTNFYPIRILSPEFSLKAFEYSDERLRDLRAQHNATHSFFRVGDHIFSSWMDGDDISGGERLLVRHEEAPEVIAGLIRHLFFKTFIRNLPNRKPLDFYPLRIVSRKESHDTVRDLLPNHLKDVVSYRRINEIQTRQVELDAKPTYGVLINIDREWRVSRTLAELKAEKYDVIGRAVLHIEELPGLAGVLAPSESAVGRIKAVEDEKAQVTTNEGDRWIPLTELSLMRSRYEIKDYLAFKLGEKEADAVLEKVFERGPLGKDARELQRELQALADYFSEWKFRTKDGFAFEISRNSNVPAKSLRLEMPRFIFDIGPGAASTSILSGLVEHGPYDSNRFTPKKPKVLVLCHSSSRAGFSKTMAVLRDGIPESRYFKLGFKDLFRLHDVEFVITEVQEKTVESYRAAIGRVLAQNGNEDINLAVVEGSEEDKSLPPRDNPYFHAKALLMGAGIPVQGLLPHRTRLSNDQLSYILGPLALQMYAKIGGTPWVLPASPEVDREIIVGVSHIVERENEFVGGAQSRVVGLATFFSSDGTFLMASKCQDVPYERYFDALLESLESSLTSLSGDYGWRDGDSVRIVFHIFKPIKGTEAAVVQALVQKFRQYNIRFAFVTVSERHPFIMFDDNSQQKSRDRGYFVPRRGTNIVLDDLSCLLQTMGKGEVRWERHGFSTPVLIRIDPNSTFRDTHHIAQQMLNFTHLSWRSFGPTLLPATLQYAELIARMLSRLRGVPNWNPQIVNTVLKRKKWFL